MGIRQEIEAAELLKAQLAQMGETDPDLVRDTIEGETNLKEMLSFLVKYDAEDEALVEATAALCKQLSDRKARIERRIEVRRALMQTAMEVGLLPKHECAAGTLSLRKAAPKLVVTDESEVPSVYFVPQAPKLDKKALLDAVKKIEAENDEAVKAAIAASAPMPALKAIPGATLSNGGATISIRR